MRLKFWIAILVIFRAAPAALLADAPTKSTLGSAVQTLGPVEVGDASKAVVPVAGKAVGRVVPVVVVTYEPAPRSATFELRRSSWDQLRIADVDLDGRALRNGLWLSESQVSAYYRAAGNTESQRLEWRAGFRNVRTRYRQFIVPPGMAVLFAAAGAAVGNAQYGTTVDGKYNYSQTLIYQRTAEDAAIGAALGLVVGEALTLVRDHYAKRQSIRDFRLAADTFNQQLLQDLHLRVMPSRGGGAVGINEAF